MFTVPPHPVNVGRLLWGKMLEIEGNLTFVLLSWFGLWISMSQGYTTIQHQTTTACFNTVLQLECGNNEVIVLDKARYGRNDMEAASRCGVQYQQTCDIDAHFHLNHLCAGQPVCSVAVNTELFGDPCGYDEFLKVRYKCVSEMSIRGNCQSQSDAQILFDHGYIESPNYPMKYYLEAHCVWHLAVQQRQTILIILHDFELAVKKDGVCKDYLFVEGVDGVEYFKDCGSLGKQKIEISSNEAIVHFVTSTSTLAQRGFFLYFEAVGPGCPDLDGVANATITYSMSPDSLTANITCDPGFMMNRPGSVRNGSPLTFQQLTCTGSTWNATPANCLEVQTTTPIPATSPGAATSNIPVARKDDPVAESASIIGIALGVVSALLLIALLVVLSLYLHRRKTYHTNKGRRRKAERKLDQWRVVINNLQESGVQDDGYSVPSVDINKYSCSNASMSSMHSLKKGGLKKNRKNRNMDDEVQGRNLLSPGMLDEDDLYDVPKNYTSVFNYDTETYRPVPSGAVLGSRRSSRTGRYSLAHSRDSELDERDDEGFREPTKQPRRKRHRRSKSGIWDNNVNHARAAIYAQESLASSPIRQPLERRLVITRSCPDLTEGGAACSGDESDESCCGEPKTPRMNNMRPLLDNRRVLYSPTRSGRIGRSSTLGAMNTHRTPRVNRNQTASKIRC